MKNAGLTFLFLLLTFILNCQPKCFFEHYGSEDGLPQHNVTGILQDKKDFIWISTWDGLCKFDGYNFHTYKIQQGDYYHMRTNRIESLHEDKYGFIWTLSYDKEAHRFDPSTERFMSLKSLDGYKKIAITTKKIKTMRSGKVWLLSDKMGCVCIIDSSFKAKVFNVENKQINGNLIYDIFEDSEYNSWILSDNGLYSFSKDGVTLTSYFSERAYLESKSVQDFYAVMELNNDIWFASNNGRIWIYNKLKKSFHLLEIPTKSKIKLLKNINNKDIFIGTENDGFFTYDISTKATGKYNVGAIGEVTGNSIINCYVDKSGRVWIETDRTGVSMFDIQNKKIKSYKAKTETPDTYIFPPGLLVIEDKRNRTWVQPRGGGFSLYDPVKDILIPFYNEPDSPDWRFSNMLHAAFFDKQDNLWLSSRSYGLEKIIFNDNVFKSGIVNSNIHSTINNDIRFIFEDRNRNLWISSKSEKIYVYDSAHNELGYVCNDGTIGYGTPLEGVAYCIFQDSEGNIWIGTKGYGLFLLSPTSKALNFRVRQYKNSTDDLYSLSNDNIYSIYEDAQKRIWIGTYGGGINMMSNKSGRFINYKNNLKGYPTQYGLQVRVVSSDRYGNICVGTTLGLIMFSADFDSVESIGYKFFTRIPGNNHSLTGNDIYDIFTSKDNTTYIATFGGGINEVSAVDKQGFPSKFISYTTKNGLPSDVALSIIEDNHGKLWITTEGFLTKFDPEIKSFQTFSEISRIIRGQNFSEGARCKLQSGIILFGYSRGFISINPDKVKNNTYKPYLALTKLQILNKDIKIDEQTILTRNIDDMKEITLMHNQNIFNVEFAALDYVDPQRILYAYKLEGFDKEWVVSNSQRLARYTNLSPGEYVFKVKSTNSDGVWVNNEHRLKIIIKPSFWQTGWAMIFYIILLSSLIYVVFRAIFIYYRLRDKVKLEYEQTEMKTKFFIDISHEIRTPLTMIVSPLQNIIDEREVSPKVQTQLNLVMKNADRMLRMVNQILDFRKLQKQKFNFEKITVGNFIIEVCEVFAKTAEVHGISMKINNLAKDAVIWGDRDSLEKLVFNLLSNAFKYSEPQAGKEIQINIFEKDNCIAIQVKDEGTGMTEAVQNKLFTRFISYNVDKSKPSTGIGLSIVKEIADKHQAKIQVESEIGEGSCFTVLFSPEKDHVSTEAKNETLDNSSLNGSDSGMGDLSSSLQSKNKGEVLSLKKELSVLIVEDDKDLCAFIESVLAPYYETVVAMDGKEGYRQTITVQPDIIISDIMMPGMSGVELLQKVRNNVDVSHIPIILLTAKTNIDSKLEGLTFGADDYITKPFNVRYLKARIDNIISQRKRLYQSYLNKGVSKVSVVEKDASQHRQLTLTSRDEEFIEKVIAEVEKNLDNSDFVVEDLASVMAMSRSVFFKKLKSITGFAPVEFIRDIRIRHAAKLITTQQYTIKEAAFMSGISDIKYFNMWFKRIMEMTPSEYKLKMKSHH